MKPAILLTLLLALLSACAPALTATPISTQPLPAVETLTQTATFLPSATPAPTTTPAPPTITPLPTIPTFTPTFDSRTIVTATLAPKAECPKENPGLLANFEVPTENNYFLGETQNDILKFLNEGGTLRALKERLDKAWGWYDNYVIQDITVDNLPEILFIGYSSSGSFYVFKCNQGQYQMYSPEIDYSIGYASKIIGIKDLNKDGNPEVVLEHRGCDGTDCADIYVFEWNGEKFVDLSSKWEENQHSEFAALKEIKIEDLDMDGLFEISLSGGIPGPAIYDYGYPFRSYTQILKWNGESFVINSIEYAPPVFRFQAIQDADLAAKMGWYEKALLFYQDAIFSDKLEWWSQERSTNTLKKLFGNNDPEKIKPADGTPDPTEYPRLAAYAYYRMIILHMYLGEMEAAQIKYATLQEKFPEGNPGHPYVEMANDFWNAYQSTGKMYNACAAAITYADAHPEILIPLGSDYHGAQSHIYVPADVCPFR